MISLASARRRARPAQWQHCGTMVHSTHPHFGPRPSRFGRVREFLVHTRFSVFEARPQYSITVYIRKYASRSGQHQTEASLKRSIVQNTSRITRTCRASRVLSPCPLLLPPQVQALQVLPCHTSGIWGSCCRCRTCISGRPAHKPNERSLIIVV